MTRRRSRVTGKKEDNDRERERRVDGKITGLRDGRKK